MHDQLQGAFMIFNVDVTDEKRFMAYADQARALLAEYGGTIVLKSANRQILEGEWPAGTMLIVHFNSMEAAKKFYFCDAYQKLIAARTSSSNSHGIIVENDQTGI